MTGMALLLICVAAADDTGWRPTGSSNAATGIPFRSDATVRPAGALAPWDDIPRTSARPGTGPLRERIGRALDNTRSAVDNLLPRRDLATGSGASRFSWQELEPTLNQPPTRPSRTLEQPESGRQFGKSGRLRVTADEDPVPQTPFRATNSGIVPRSSRVREESASNWSDYSDPPATPGQLNEWLDEPSDAERRAPAPRTARPRSRFRGTNDDDTITRRDTARLENDAALMNDWDDSTFGEDEEAPRLPRDRSPRTTVDDEPRSTRSAARSRAQDRDTLDVEARDGEFDERTNARSRSQRDEVADERFDGESSNRPTNRRRTNTQSSRWADDERTDRYLTPPSRSDDGNPIRARETLANDSSLDLPPLREEPDPNWTFRTDSGDFDQPAPRNTPSYDDPRTASVTPNRTQRPNVPAASGPWPGGNFAGSDPERTASGNPQTNQQAASPSDVTGSVGNLANRPWWPFLWSVLGLFASIGFNVYLGWIAWDLYTRYQDAVDDVQELETRLEKQQTASELSMPTSRSGRAAVTSG